MGIVGQQDIDPKSVKIGVVFVERAKNPSENSKVQLAGEDIESKGKADNMDIISEKNGKEADKKLNKGATTISQIKSEQVINGKRYIREEPRPRGREREKERSGRKIRKEIVQLKETGGTEV